MYTPTLNTKKETVGNVIKHQLEPNNKMCVDYYAGEYLEDGYTME